MLIVKFFGFLETNNQLLIKMEFIKYGTLSKWIKNHKKISEEDASIISYLYEYDSTIRSTAKKFNKSKCTFIN